MAMGLFARLRWALAMPVLSALLALSALPARADDYPSRPVKIIVPFGAGGPTDVSVRALAVELQKSLHQSVVIENRP
jgi:tripartite-type tricarboxylate transporter receptor subunit TctC